MPAGSLSRWQGDVKDRTAFPGQSEARHDEAKIALYIPQVLRNYACTSLSLSDICFDEIDALISLFVRVSRLVKSIFHYSDSIQIPRAGHKDSVDFTVSSQNQFTELQRKYQYLNHIARERHPHSFHITSQPYPKDRSVLSTADNRRPLNASCLPPSSFLSD